MIKSAFGLDDGIETHRRGLSDHRLRFPGLQQCSAIKTVAFFPTTRNVCVAYVDMYYIYENACKVRASRQRAPTARGCREVEITPVRPTRLDVLKLFFFIFFLFFFLPLSLTLSFSLSVIIKAWYAIRRDRGAARTHGVHDPAPLLLATTPRIMSTGYLRSRALPPHRRYNSLLNCLNVEKRTDKESFAREREFNPLMHFKD